MKVFKLSAMFSLMAAFCLNCSAPVYAEICNRIVAVVNNEVITLYELNGKIKELTGITAAEMERQDKQGYMEARRKVLDLLIDEKIAQEKVKELGIEVTPNEVDNAIEGIKRRNHWTQEDLMAGLDKQGVQLEQYRGNIKKELEQMRLIDFEVKSKIIVLEDAIKEYYDTHIDEFKSEEKVRLAIILLPQKDPSNPDETIHITRQAEKISSSLKDGEDFGELAKRFSQGPGAEEGGEIGFIKTAHLDPKLKEVIHNMAEGDVSEPINTPSGIQIIKLLEKNEKGVKTIEEVKGAIYDILYGKEINDRYSSWIKDLRDKAYIKIIF